MAHMDLGWVWSLTGLTQSEKSVLAYVTSMANRKDDNRCWPSQPSIATAVGIGSTKTVRRALVGLERKGLIRRHGRLFENGRQSSDMITVQIGRTPNLPQGHHDPPTGSPVPPVAQPQGHHDPGAGSPVPTNREPNRDLANTEEVREDDEEIAFDPSTGEILKEVNADGASEVGEFDDSIFRNLRSA